MVYFSKEGSPEARHLKRHSLSNSPRHVFCDQRKWGSKFGDCGPNDGLDSKKLCQGFSFCHLWRNPLVFCALCHFLWSCSEWALSNAWIKNPTNLQTFLFDCMNSNIEWVQVCCTFLLTDFASLPWSFSFRWRSYGNLCCLRFVFVHCWIKWGRWDFWFCRLLEILECRCCHDSSPDLLLITCGSKEGKRKRKTDRHRDTEKRSREFSPKSSSLHSTCKQETGNHGISGATATVAPFNFVGVLWVSFSGWIVPSHFVYHLHNRQTSISNFKVSFFVGRWRDSDNFQQNQTHVSPCYTFPNNFIVLSECFWNFWWPPWIIWKKKQAVFSFFPFCWGIPQRKKLFARKVNKRSKQGKGYTTQRRSSYLPFLGVKNRNPAEASFLNERKLFFPEMKLDPDNFLPKRWNTWRWVGFIFSRGVPVCFGEILPSCSKTHPYFFSLYSWQFECRHVYWNER